MPQGRRKDIHLHVHGLREPLATPNRRASPEKMLGICVCVATVRAGGGVEVRRSLLDRCPRRPSGHMLEDTLGFFVKASEGGAHKVTVNVDEAFRMGTGTPSPACAVGVAPVRGRISNVWPRRAQGMDRREARPAQPQVLGEGGTMFVELVKEEPHR